MDRKDDWDELLGESVPPALRDRVRKSVAPLLAQNAESGTTQERTLPAWLTAFFAGGLATAAFAFFFLRSASRKGAPPGSEGAPLAYDLEMIRDVDLLLDLRVLERWGGKGGKNG